ncbi:MAG: hypothetical protein L6Q94_01115 [Calditrichia bacterium]|nr:hypothetical protein [Calditrichia bacterium]
MSFPFSGKDSLPDASRSGKRKFSSWKAHLGVRSIKIPLNILHSQKQEEYDMLQNFTKYAGLAQTAIGLLGQFAPGIGPALGGAMGTATGGNVFNMLSGAALSYLGFKGTESNQRTGALGIGGLNAIVGLLSAFSMSPIGPISLNESMISWIINLAIGAWGLIAGFMKKKA